MGKVEQTKGSFRLAGMTNIEKVEQKDFGWIKKANLSVKTLKDNFVTTTFEIKNGKGLDLNIKANGDEKSHKVSANEAFSEVKETFKNDDMLFVVGVADYDTYRKEFVLKPSGVFYSTSNYNDEDFSETNFIEHEFIFNKLEDDKAIMNLVTYFGEVIEIDMKVDQELIDEFKTFKFGDLITVNFSVINKPNYVDAEESKSSGYTPKGRGVGGNKKRTTDGFITYNLIVGVLDVTKEKYTRKDIRDAQEEFEKKQAEYQTKKELTNTQSTQEDEEDDLPY